MRWTPVLLVTAVTFSLVGFWWWGQLVLPPQPGNKESVAFVVARDRTGHEIINQLASVGLVKSAKAARIYLYLLGLQNKLQAGSFVLSRGQTLAEVFEALTGPAVDVWVTIPEGWRREQIAARLQNVLVDSGFDAQDFLASTQELEGRLFPDTYLIPRSATASDVIKIMTTNFALKTEIDPQEQREMLILASLVEREANSDADRPVIAGILAKRLRAGWPLQVDATIQYALGVPSDWWPDNIDTKFPSVYNTYLRTGLTPGPIANPGLASINAARHPQDSIYWYYLHAPDGAVYYAKTIEEHNANIDKYLW